MSSPSHTARQGFEVRFASLFNAGRGLSFPCDREGKVDLATLTEQARRNYLSACERIGREFATPQIRQSVLTY